MKFNSSKDVLSVFATRSQLTSSDGLHVISMTSLRRIGTWNQSCRKSGSLIIKLAQLDQKCVLIKGHTLYVNSKLYGYATPGGFYQSTSFGDVAASLLAS